MLSKNIMASRSFKCEDGIITVDAGECEWQIVWENGGGVTHAKTSSPWTDDNLASGIAYLRENRSDLIEVGNLEEGEKGTVVPQDEGFGTEPISEECSDDQCCCGEACGDNREEVIERAKKHLCYATNIESRPDEMQCLDSFLFRCWQMGWLRDYDDTQPEYDAMRKALCIVKDAFETIVIYAPGESPTYEQADKAREVYKAVCDALGKKGVKKAKAVSKS